MLKFVSVSRINIGDLNILSIKCSYAGDVHWTGSFWVGWIYYTIGAKRVIVRDYVPNFRCHVLLLKLKKRGMQMNSSTFHQSNI